MSPAYVSEKDLFLKRKLNDVRNFLELKHVDMVMDVSTYAVYCHALFRSAEAVELHLSRPRIRNVGEISIGDIHEMTAPKFLLLALRRQVHAACFLSDAAEGGPPLSQAEVEALSKVEEELERLYNIVFPETSPRASDTDSDSD
ncbi:unnamed protein product [Auanema sp. JU1783]|nr:unnamed protein product [Auanema sp. JU1783]